MSSLVRGRVPLNYHNDHSQFWGKIMTPLPEDDPASPNNRAAALQNAAQEYFRPDARERAIFWTDASTAEPTDSHQPEGGFEGGPTSAAIVWRRPLSDGGWEWADEAYVHKCQCCAAPDCWYHPCTIRRAELTAVLLALRRGFAAVHMDARLHVVSIYTDNLRIVDTIRMYHTELEVGPPGPSYWGRDVLRRIIRTTNAIRAQGVEVEIQWVPRENEVIGNQLADFAARRAIGLWPPFPTQTWEDKDKEQVNRLEAWHCFARRDREQAERLLRSLRSASNSSSHRHRRHHSSPSSTPPLPTSRHHQIAAKNFKNPWKENQLAKNPCIINTTLDFFHPTTSFSSNLLHGGTPWAWGGAGAPHVPGERAHTSMSCQVGSSPIGKSSIEVAKMISACVGSK